MRFPKTDGPLKGHPMAKGVIGEGETRGCDCLGFHPLCQIEGSRVIGVQSQQRLPYHPSWTVQMGLDTQDEALRGNSHEDKPPYL